MSEAEKDFLRKEIKKGLASADERMLRLMYTMLEADQEGDWWDSLSKEAKEAIDNGIAQADAGNTITHQEFLAQNKRWLPK